MKKILMYFGSLIFIFQSIGLNTAIANDDLIQTNFSMAPSYSAPGMSLNQVAAAIARENGGVGNIASLAQSRGDIQVTNLPAANGGQQLAASQGLRGAILEIISTLLGNSVGNIASPTQSRGDTQVTNLPARNNDPSNTGLKVVRSPLAPNEAGAGRAGLQNPCADIIIGNAPFGDWGVVDTHAPPMLRHKYLQAKVHDYFVCKAVSLLNPGGVVATITHNSTMDREEVGVREWLNEHAELVAAYRLPANLWEEQGAAPVSDVLVMRRRG